MQINLPNRVIRDIRTFAEDNAVKKVVLFGSRARGDNGNRSDVDIAVYGGDFDSFYWDIKEKTHSLLTFDMVQMDTNVTEELKNEIKRDGVTIYEKAREFFKLSSCIKKCGF